jgi:hypothetical protein
MTGNAQVSPSFSIRVMKTIISEQLSIYQRATVLEIKFSESNRPRLNDPSIPRATVLRSPRDFRSGAIANKKRCPLTSAFPPPIHTHMVHPAGTKPSARRPCRLPREWTVASSPRRPLRRPRADTASLGGRRHTARIAVKSPKAPRNGWARRTRARYQQYRLAVTETERLA